MISLIKNMVDANERRLKKYYKLVEKINEIEPEFEKLSDQELQQKTIWFKQQLQNGKTIDDIKVEAFATVREAAKRILGMRHYDVQLIGGLVLTEGNIAEMATGEGKTLVASLPSYLRALEGKGVHVITVNEYLAKRDREIIGPIHEFLGLTVGLNLPLMEQSEKKQAYLADITYGVGTEFGFDYLRDNMATRAEDRVQRPYHFAIIDEVDSILIDEAKTPLIIAGKVRASSELHYIAAQLAKKFKNEEDYSFDMETKAVSLTDQGIEKVENAFGIDNLYDLEHQILYHYVIQAVRAHVMFERDVDYIVKDGKIFLVDSFTGRIMEGRTLSDGLHQAIEAKEGLEITEENKTQASITIQNYFRMYPYLSGMTGTAKTEEQEFLRVYNMEVIQIPTNKPKQRIDLPDRIYKTIHDKYTAVAKEVKKRHEKGQPVLIGTTSILQSEKLAKYLDQEHLDYELLNAKSADQEAALIAKAGQRGQITIATNMAGRGTDIILEEGVAQLGGLHVIGTERHESRRIDNQLKGRAGRQGDPGSTQFFISLEDDMFQRFASKEMEKLSKKIETDSTGLVLNKKMDEFVNKIQRIVEGSNFSVREYNLKLDDVINMQRNVIYGLRNKIIDESDLLKLYFEMIDSAVKEQIQRLCPETETPDNWRLNQLLSTIQSFIPGETVNLPEGLEDLKDVEEAVFPAVASYKKRIEQLNFAEWASYIKEIMLSVIDRHWIDHMESMTRLKEGIGLRSYQQEDPMRLYQKEGYEIFLETYHEIEKEISVRIAAFLKEMQTKE
ncbi:accessory Sec system translocase SecA2 [Bacillus smithii]|uniref:Protein translocase subunit SecA n=1 Tax=Bacillus smithii 7_3_47FAA TaxID=665952 RepID=G9QM05_9BACI|nr:accessory Sec system translocase SecA2 [Bacillus smithii]EHL77376.1 preprotein translocase, SecA subunit [Bacillus smithii 7_3_47FAA]